MSKQVIIKSSVREVITRYPGRYYSQGDFLYNDVCSNSMEMSLDEYWKFKNWIIGRYRNEFIEHENHYMFLNKHVLVIGIDDINMLDEEEFFLPNYDLYNELNKNSFARLYSQYKMSSLEKI